MCLRCKHEDALEQIDTVLGRLALAPAARTYLEALRTSVEADAHIEKVHRLAVETCAAS